MATYEFDSVIDEKRHLALPAEIPSGIVRVRVVFQEQQLQPSAAAPNTANLFQEFSGLPLRNRSREDIDAYLREERDSWE